MIKAADAMTGGAKSGNAYHPAAICRIMAMAYSGTKMT